MEKEEKEILEIFVEMKLFQGHAQMHSLQIFSCNSRFIFGHSERCSQPVTIV